MEIDKTNPSTNGSNRVEGLPKVDYDEFEEYKRFLHENNKLLTLDVEKTSKNNMSLSVDDDFNECFCKQQELKNCNLHLDPSRHSSQFPAEHILVGRSLVDEQMLLVNDIKNQGNIYIGTSYQENLSGIDNFIVSYIFSVVSSFPLGRVQFHIVDSENKYCYAKLFNNMTSADANLLCKGMFSRYSSTAELIKSLKQKVDNEIAKKLTLGIDDMYGLMPYDEDEVFRFVIIRNSISNELEDTLATLRALTESRDTAHRCGIRFLVVDSSKEGMDYPKYVLTAIKKNCQIRFTFQDDSFYLGDELIEPVSVGEDVVSYIETATRHLFEALMKKGSRAIDHRDVLPKEQTKQQLRDPIIRIPVGKSGSKTFDLPFSCANKGGTPEGNCVSYMVIGRTGAGKSSFMNSIIINGSRKYSPDDLSFWVIDFKYGKETKEYSESGIPHISMVAAKNTPEDALNILRMLESECERRNKIFAKEGCRDLYDYNEKRDACNQKHMPHIIVLIDEAQDLAQSDDYDIQAELRKSIQGLSDKIRSSGIHLVLIAQNISNDKCGLLSYFILQAAGRVAFQLDEKAVTDADFGSGFRERREEFPLLANGTAYVSISGVMQKVRFAFTEDKHQYFNEIKLLYSDYKTNLKIVGKTDLLGPQSKSITLDKSYESILSTCDNRDSFVQSAVVGENTYSLEPFRIRFSTNEPSSLLIYGGRNHIATSIMKSIVVSLSGYTKNQIRVFNGDVNVEESSGEEFNFLTKYCTDSKNLCLKIFPKNKFEEELTRIYSDVFLSRKEEAASLLRSISFEPVFLLVNDASSISDFASQPSNSLSQTGRLPVGAQYIDEDNVPGPEDYDDVYADVNSSDLPISVSAKEAFLSLINEGYKYNIHVIMSLVGSGNGKAFEFKDSFARAIYYNNIAKYDLPSVGGMQGRIFDLLSSIKNNGDETMAVYIEGTDSTKLRPIIY